MSPVDKKMDSSQDTCKGTLLYLRVPVQADDGVVEDRVPVLLPLVLGTHLEGEARHGRGHAPASRESIVIKSTVIIFVK